MTEPDRIKQRLRDASTMTELRAVWASELDEILKQPEPMKTQIVNLKDYRKAGL